MKADVFIDPGLRGAAHTFDFSGVRLTVKLLPIDATYRRWLTTRNAIGFNADLQERLAGLTYDESLFYIKKFAVFAVAWFTVSDADISRFLDLHERHASSYEFGGS